MTLSSTADAFSAGAVGIASTEEIVAELRAGRMVILVDDEERENEGDLILAAEHVTPDAINFMVTHGRGLVCLAMTQAQGRQLGLAPMTRDNNSPFNTAFTTSIEAATGVTTGISTHDRARTIKVAAAKDAKPEDVVQPGHIFPIIARSGGVLIRAGHTEAGCDLSQMAGLLPSAVLCEILKEDGTMARLPDLMAFACRHGLKIGTIADLIEFRSRNETLIERVLSRSVTLAGDEFTLHAYTDRVSNETHLALTRGEILPDNETWVRVYEPLSILDFLGLTSHPFPLPRVQKAMACADAGVIILLRQQASENILDVFHETNEPLSRNRWDSRLYGIGAQILRDLGVRKMALIASPRHLPSMAGFGLEVTRQIGNLDEMDGIDRSDRRQGI